MSFNESMFDRPDFEGHAFTQWRDRLIRTNEQAKASLRAYASAITDGPNLPGKYAHGVNYFNREMFPVLDEAYEVLSEMAEEIRLMRSRAAQGTLPIKHERTEP